MKQQLFATENKKVFIAAHRGTFGGNIIQNTLGAFENALQHGAHILELDAVLSKDNIFYVFHDGYEMEVLGVKQTIPTMLSEEIDEIRCINAFEQKSGTSLSRLEDVIERFRGRALINVDRSWHHWEEMIQFLHQHQAHDFVILKSPVNQRLLEILSKSQTNIMYMPIVKTIEDYHMVCTYDVNMVGVELIFEGVTDELVSSSMMEHFRKKQLFTWVNAIDLGQKYNLSANLTDTGAIIEHPDAHWGKLIDIGFDVFQTDWPSLLKAYVEKR